MRRALPAVLWAALIFVASAQSQLPQAPLGLLDVLLKKGAHLAEYAILAVLIYRGLRPGTPARPWPRTALAWALATLYAVSDEVHQSFRPGRVATPVDVAVDATGALLGLAAVRVSQRVRSRGERGLAIARCAVHSPSENPGVLGSPGT